MLKRLLGLALTAYALTATSAAAQVELKSKATELTVTGRVHLQWNSTSVDDELSNEFLMRRARLTAELKINDVVSGKI
jgi:CRISPR/Cas system-associated exonuclease Cas4 (RecB family)